jgi:hypothetical protein
LVTPSPAPPLGAPYTGWGARKPVPWTPERAGGHPGPGVRAGGSGEAGLAGRGPPGLLCSPRASCGRAHLSGRTGPGLAGVTCWSERVASDASPALSSAESSRPARQAQLPDVPDDGGGLSFPICHVHGQRSEAAPSRLHLPWSLRKSTSPWSLSRSPLSPCHEPRPGHLRDREKGGGRAWGRPDLDPP